MTMIKIFEKKKKTKRVTIGMIEKGLRKKLTFI